MKFFEFYMKEESNYTKEMEDWFIERTNRHIDLVKKYAVLIEEYDPITFKGLTEIAEDHDKSKFGNVEKDPYIFISWNYHCKKLGKKFDIPEDIQIKMHKASEHHIHNNQHHPEFYDETSTVNIKDRDKPPEKIVDATDMPTIYIGEMLSDWMAMSEELNDSTKDWADKNVNIRWKFTPEQTKLIYEVINNVKE